ncbi:bifunctional prephenate dehydrogenase/3-phosphoshikimate 1-carboxyvinyltransferase [Kushneria phosphatilytica]|uniref:3-phosphoshikimate 1-carboxyvinyltransferase n=1 Tax=Kushneria phosphatilytica TaxID=657387 RepID=A0A1S1NSZ2_9GAMM|nr:bifunctional prephenate dehydrogenase/3-phosphoshikimate 1-carboxyvinyltransferase [Kushneria phosphatilytica]OHV12369.1 bifunctional prephenate dehydrogenase/3-phosphoshikimate 1-carboxyvinyltransferase [Kushneria phosphatilytica]QEL12815.1 bifunctional prephenate dehydrogenase/3-phosphoshikimate 1-carboxyvinyltransferase [Kushneria phosphatilytica]
MPDEQGILVIGLGLIGSSLLAALRKNGYQGRLLGCDRDKDSVATALEMQLIDEGHTEPQAMLSSASLVVLAVPVMTLPELVGHLAPSVRPDQVMTDVGSTKGAMCEAIIRRLGEMPSWLVPGHPIAGSERSGVSAANAELYCRHRVILTPVDQTAPTAVTRVEKLWRACGAEVETLSVEHHDAVLARTSHLPHLLAFSLVDGLARRDERLEIFRYAAGGFRDFTRIAGSDPVMWRDIYLANRDAVLAALNEFESGVKQLRQAVESGDGDAMLSILSRASHARHYFDTLLNQKSYQAMEQRNIRYRAAHGGKVQGRIRVPGDKSMSHRAIMLGALAEGVTEVEGFLEGEDSLATLQAFREMGVAIEGPHQGRVVIHGVGLHGLKQPAGALYLGNSGTAMRLFSGLLAGQSFTTTLTGDASLTRRPMDRVAQPLRLMGASIETAEGGRPPLSIHGKQGLRGIDYDMPMASAQVKSCLLLAGMYAEGTTRVREPATTRDHTERMLTGFGYPVRREGDQAIIEGGGRLTAGPIDVPADISSAAFFLVAAAITPEADLVLEHVGINPTRIGVINILRQMGANLELLDQREVGGEPVADIRVRHSRLKGIDIPVDQVPLAIDELPVLFIAAANAEGVTRLREASELRVKESDRLQAMADGLTVLGVEHTLYEDGIDITGGHYGGGRVDSLGDHRIAMAFTVAALRAGEDILIEDCANVATSFPDFLQLVNRIGLRVEEQTVDS